MNNKPQKQAPKAPTKAAAPKARLAVTVDGKALPDDEARAIWVAFSAHMDANEGDFAGFAKSRGWASSMPEHLKGQAVLVVKTR